MDTKKIAMIVIALMLAGLMTFMFNPVEHNPGLVAVEIAGTLSEQWDVSVLKKNATREYANSIDVNRDTLGGMLALYKKLGSMNRKPVCNPVSSERLPDSRKIENAGFDCVAGYENGNANFHIILQRNNSYEQWLINQLSVSSPQVMPSMKDLIR